MKKELKQLQRWAAERGWSVTVTGRNHLRWVNPKVSRCVFSALTPSCSHAVKNIRSLLLRYETMYAK